MADLLQQLRDELTGSYTIERELGGGGMSRVFVAEEVALGRRVVIKVLPADLSGNVSLARFKREISLAARLQHPHIVPLLSVGAFSDGTFYTMPFVEGASLRSRIASGQVPISEAISILRDVARALDYAHSKGIAHRDIKPDNILLAGSSAVITDFGVAKALQDAVTSEGLTSVGVALGTPAYMAPEQVAADPGVDYRADIYSFGATAYETLTGRPPFADKALHAMMAAHITDTPRPISELRSDIPAPLADLVMRCLAKDPSDRPQSAADIASSLEATSTAETPAVAHAPQRKPFTRSRLFLAIAGTALTVAVIAFALWQKRVHATSSEIRAIAVLPFENASRDSTFDYLEDGISDQVRDALNAVPELTVKARSSSRLLRNETSRTIGDKLGVGAVVEGTVTPSKSHLHVTAELVRTSDDVALWSTSFDGRPDELAGIQNRIAAAIVARLGLSRSASSSVGTAGRVNRGTSSIDAYDHFLKGRYAFDRSQFEKASREFRDAVQTDPHFARAYGYLAMSYGNETVIGVGPLDSLNALSSASAARAIALDSTVAEAYVARAYTLLSEMRFRDALKQFEKSARVDSTNADILSNYALALAQVGQLDEALPYALRGRDSDPLSATANGIYSAVLYMMGRYDEAIAAIRVTLDIDPKSVLPYQALGYYLAFNGMPDSAVTAFETGYRINTDIYLGRANLVFGYAAAGRWDDATRQRLAIQHDSKAGSPNLQGAVADIAFGEYDAAIAAIDRAITNREIMVGVESLACDPIFDPLKSNPRFTALLTRIGARPCPPRSRWPIGTPRPSAP